MPYVYINKSTGQYLGIVDDSLTNDLQKAAIYSFGLRNTQKLLPIQVRVETVISIVSHDSPLLVLVTAKGLFLDANGNETTLQSAYVFTKGRLDSFPHRDKIVSIFPAEIRNIIFLI